MTSKVVTVLAAIALAGVAAVSSTSCFVHRRSGDLPTCMTDVECLLAGGDGVCDHGYCVDAESVCPSPCTTCNVGEKTCEVQCSSGNCGAVKCPPGYDCTIRCGNGSCGDIDCAEAQHCKIDCSGAMACGNVNCGPAACDISCSGQNACPRIDCASSCQCDVSCNSSGAACPSMSCPVVGGTPCTRLGTAGGNCDSTPAGCDTCP